MEATWLRKSLRVGPPKSSERRAMNISRQHLISREGKTTRKTHKIQVF